MNISIGSKYSVKSLKDSVSGKASQKLPVFISLKPSIENN